MTNLTVTDSSLHLIRAEQARQFADAAATWQDAAQRELAQQIAALLREPGASLQLLGMGGSHHANQTALAAYRKLGLMATAMSLDEALGLPQPPDPRRVTLIASQSGDSGEIQRYLECQSARIYGLSLNPQGYLAQHVPTLLSAGGPEVAYAATRSFVLTLALHHILLEALRGRAPQTEFLPVVPPADSQTLKDVTTVVFVGSGKEYGLAQMAALGTLELARFPALSFELGQFRHGPLELLAPQVGVVLLTGDTLPYWQSSSGDIQRLCTEAGSPMLTLSTAASTGDLREAIALCPAIQNLIIDLALQHVPNVGQPIRSSKVTR